MEVFEDYPDLEEYKIDDMDSAIIGVSENLDGEDFLVYSINEMERLLKDLGRSLAEARVAEIIESSCRTSNPIIFVREY